MCFLTLLFLSLTAMADKYTYPMQKTSALGIADIRITGVKGSLKFKHRATNHYAIIVTHSKGKHFEDWFLSVERQRDTLVLEVFNVALGPQWRTSVRHEQWPEFDVTIEGPSRPTVIGWREGEIEVTDWRADIEASFISGRLEVTGMQGDLRLQAVEGHVRVANHKGRVALKGEKGRVELERVRGDIELSWVGGAIRTDRVEGKMQLDSNDANLQSRHSRGEWTVQLAQGQARFENQLGRLQAKGQNSRWEFAIAAPVDLEVLSDTGAVHVQSLRGDSKIFLSSKSGNIRVPKGMIVENRSEGKVVDGGQRLSPRGQVFVRTQSGDIVWQ